MNNYVKYCPNVWVAKCTEKHEKGEIIPVATKYGKENDSIVYNFLGEKDGFYFYSIVRAEYWERRKSIINLSMPESLEFYEFELEKAKAKHEGLKNGTIERGHSFSLTYAKKEVNELEIKIKTAKKLWG